MAVTFTAGTDVSLIHEAPPSRLVAMKAALGLAVASPPIQTDFTGAMLDGAGLGTANLPGSRLAGADLDGAIVKNVSMAGVFAPGLHDVNSLEPLSVDNFASATLNGANFSGSTIDDSTFVAADLDGAAFRSSILTRAVELNFANARGSDFRGVTSTGTLVFLTDFTNANLRGGNFTPLIGDEPHAIFCNTTMADGTVNNRDC